ncbi:MAG: hypothetical protein ACO3UU_13335, partial [Minisyncoccia bacterium]
EVEGGLAARQKHNHKDGRDHFDNYSLPIEYNLEGELINDIEVGKSVVVSRTKRNGVDAYGIFKTSRVTEVGNNYFKTMNSVYSYKFL